MIDPKTQTKPPADSPDEELKKLKEQREAQNKTIQEESAALKVLDSKVESLTKVTAETGQAGASYEKDFPKLDCQRRQLDVASHEANDRVKGEIDPYARQMVENIVGQFDKETEQWEKNLTALREARDAFSAAYQKAQGDVSDTKKAYDAKKAVPKELADSLQAIDALLKKAAGFEKQGDLASAYLLDNEAVTAIGKVKVPTVKEYKADLDAKALAYFNAQIAATAAKVKLDAAQKDYDEYAAKLKTRKDGRIDELLKEVQADVQLANPQPASAA